jgi:hypothetical protein
MSISFEDTLLNTFAIRSFRDTADRDYIHARLAYKAQLIPQFQWSALHCLEKYSKCILLLNRIPAKKLRHEITGALDLIAKHGAFEVELSPKSLEFINRLETGAEFRYFEVSYSNKPHDLLRLDLAVSELRRYCQCLDWFRYTESAREPSFQPMLEIIRHAAKNSPMNTCIMNGWLENIIKNKKHPGREALIWKNLFFGSTNRKVVRLRGYIEAGNAPLYMHPEILDEVLKYVYLPNRLVKEWREEIKPKA